MAKEDYYAQLGVDKAAGTDAIKRAYRKLAMEYHPDRNPGSSAAEKKFKEIAEAYHVLKDEQKRAAYDRFGHDAFEAGGGGPGGFERGFATGFADIFDEMFGEFVHGAGRRGAAGVSCWAVASVWSRSATGCAPGGAGATAGWARTNCRAAALRSTPCAVQISVNRRACSMRCSGACS